MPLSWVLLFSTGCNWADGFTYHQVIFTFIIGIIGHRYLGFLGRSSIFPSWGSLQGKASLFCHPPLGGPQPWLGFAEQVLHCLVALVTTAGAFSGPWVGPSRWLFGFPGQGSLAKRVLWRLALNPWQDCKLRGRKNRLRGL